MRLHQLLHEARFDDPDGAHLSPAGEYNLRLGVIKELRPELIATHQGSARGGGGGGLVVVMVAAAVVVMLWCWAAAVLDAAPPPPTTAAQNTQTHKHNPITEPITLCTKQGEVRVFEGHAFIVEAAVSVGGAALRPGLNVYRFANRIPLLFEAGNDVITKTAAKRVQWSAYKINQNADRVGVFVSIVSTKIPFKGAGKEYVGDDVDEMVAAVKSAIAACGLQLKAKIARQQAAREHQQRKRNLTKYIPNAAAALFKVLEAMAGAPPKGPKRRRLQEREDVLVKVQRGEVTGGVCLFLREGHFCACVLVCLCCLCCLCVYVSGLCSPATGQSQRASNANALTYAAQQHPPHARARQVTEALLASRLADHVERIDTDMALEYQVQQGLAAGAAKEALFLAPATARHRYGAELHAGAAVVRLLEGFG